MNANQGFDFESAIRCMARDGISEVDDPDGDVPPIVVTEGPRGIVGIGFNISDRDTDNRATMLEIAAALGVVRATRAAMICMAWVSDKTEGRQGQRQEAVMVTIVDLNNVRILFAPVQRNRDMPPDLGSWIEADEEGARVAGAFINALRYGLTLSGSVDGIPGLDNLLKEAWADGERGVAEATALLVKVMSKEGIESG